MSDNSKNSGIGFVNVLTLIFITLKLLKLIDWSWWWVLSPIWISILLVISFVILFMVIAVIFLPEKKQ